ncbi:MAG: hypothetical protein AAF297_01510 [Planctomycetota bacterium]
MLRNGLSDSVGSCVGFVRTARGRAVSGRVSLGVVAAAAGLVLPGCRDRDELAQSVADANVVLRAPQDGADAAYDEVLRLVPSGGSGTDGVAQEAGVLRSLALIGQGTSQMSEASQLERRFGYRADALRSMLAAWTDLNSQAEAAAAFDPTRQIDELERQGETRAREIEVLRVERAERASTIEALQQRISGLLERASATRADAGEMRVEASRSSAQDAARLAVRIRELTRSADGQEREALRLRAQAEITQPELNELDARLAQRAEQSRVIAQAITDLTARLDSERTRSLEHRERAAETAVEISRLADEALTFLSDEISPMLTEAGELFERAAREARSSGSSAAALLTHSVAEQRLAELLLLQSRGSLKAALLFEALAEVTPPLPGASRFAEAASEARESVDEARASARDRFESAASSAGRVRLSGSARQMASDLSDRLNAAAAGPEDLMPMDDTDGAASEGASP